MRITVVGDEKKIDLVTHHTTTEFVIGEGLTAGQGSTDLLMGLAFSCRQGIALNDQHLLGDSVAVILHWTSWDLAVRNWLQYRQHRLDPVVPQDLQLFYS